MAPTTVNSMADDDDDNDKKTTAITKQHPNSNEFQSESTRQFYNTHVDEYIQNINKSGVTHLPPSHLISFMNYLHESFPKQNQQRRRRRQATTTTNPNNNDKDDTTITSTPRFKILELGCGHGRDAFIFLNTYNDDINYIGTDYSRSMLDKASSLNPGGHFIEMDHLRLAKTFTSNSFDGLWACATLLHVSKENMKKVVVGGMMEVLRPGGVVYVSVKEGKGETFDPDERYGGIRKFYSFWEREELVEVFKRRGFEILECGVEDHRGNDSYATHPFIHLYAKVPMKGKG